MATDNGSLFDNRVRIATDGSVLVNPDGPGGWAVVFEDGRTMSGSSPATTNNRMEMQAVLEGLRAIEHPADVVVECDSQYVCKGLTTWIHGWRKTDFRGGKIKNVDLWMDLWKQVERHLRVTMVWVRGHDGHEANELADKLAGEAARAQAGGLAIEAPAVFAPEAIARRFHEAYERLADEHDYKTRPESAVPWADVPESNRKLMIAVAEELLEEGVILYGGQKAKARVDC